MRNRIVLAALSLSLLARTWDASAQAARAVAPSTPGATLGELELRVRALEAERDAARKTLATATAVAVGASGVTFRAPDGSFQARFRGYVQEDGRFFTQDAPPAASAFLLRRVRPIIEGTVFRHYDFRIMTDFGGGSASLQDAYVDANYRPEFRIRFGKFNPYIGLERIQSATSLLFVERGLPSNLIPSRDVGVQLQGDLGGGTVSYAVGVFNGAVDGGIVDSDTNAGKDIAGRVFLQPFLDSGIGALRGLGFGVGASRGRQDQATPTATGLASYRTPIQQPFFSYRSDGTADGTTLADGARVRIAPQGFYYLGPIGVQSEYVTSTQHVRRGGASADLKHSAWQVGGSVVLTGEKASFSGVKPRHDFAPTRGSLGALQLASRVDRQELDDAAFPLFADPARASRSAHAWAVGLNWYLNQNVKFVVDYERTGFQGGSAAGDRATESGIVSRVQLSF